MCAGCLPCVRCSSRRKRQALCSTGTTTTGTIQQGRVFPLRQLAQTFLQRSKDGFSSDHRGHGREENTFGTCVGRVKAGPMSFARFSTDDVHGKIRGYTGGGRFTDDPLETFGGAGVVEIPGLQKLLRYICDNGFEHHVAANFSSVAPIVHEATTRYLNWEMYPHHG